MKLNLIQTEKLLAQNFVHERKWKTLFLLPVVAFAEYIVNVKLKAKKQWLAKIGRDSGSQARTLEYQAVSVCYIFLY